MSSDDSQFWENLEALHEQHWVARSFKGSGELEFGGTLRFSGEWRGNVHSSDAQARLFVMADARVQGKIRVAALSVEGRISEADIEVERLHVLPGAHIQGKIKAKQLRIEPGAVIQGEVASARAHGKQAEREA